MVKKYNNIIYSVCQFFDEFFYKAENIYNAENIYQAENIYKTKNIYQAENIYKTKSIYQAEYYLTKNIII